MYSVPQNYINDKVLADEWSQLKTTVWGELKQESAIALKKLLELTMEIEVQDLIGSRRWQHNNRRSNYRNGYRRRSLLSSFGYLSHLNVPRVREGGITFNCLRKYKRRAPDVDLMILEMFLCGVSTREVQNVLEPLYGPGSISATGVSRISKTLNKYVNKYHTRKLDDDYLYLIVDGVYFNVKNPIWKKRRCVLVAYGIKSTGQREIIDFYLTSHGESQAAWEKFLNMLYNRGFEGRNLRLIVRDGCKALINALENIFPTVAQQPCWAHKLRNVANRLPKHLQDACINQARNIYNADNYDSALKTFKLWANSWHRAAPAAVKCLNDDIYNLLNFFNEPKSMWIKLRTTNIIERCFREVRKRTRPMSCFQNSDSVQRIIFAIFTKQNKKWENKPLKITHNT
jgi:transposase-like protein